jgi:glutaredoxin
MQGCPHCQDIKEMLDNDKIEFIERDIDEFDEEYGEYQKIVEGNEFVPAFLCVEIDGNKVKRYEPLAPDRDFQELSEALEKVKKFIKG